MELLGKFVGWECLLPIKLDVIPASEQMGSVCCHRKCEIGRLPLEKEASLRKGDGCYACTEA